VRNEIGPQGGFCLGVMSVPMPTPTPYTDRTSFGIENPYSTRGLFFSI